MRNRSFLLAVLLAIAVLAPGAARAGSFSDPVPHEQMCQRGEFLVAIQAKLATTRDHVPDYNYGVLEVTPICAPWLPAERKFGNTHALTPIGWANESPGNNTFPVTTESCPLYGVVKAIHFQWGGWGATVWNISIDCVRPAAAEAVIDTQSELVSMPPQASSLASGCPVGNVAVGVNLITSGRDYIYNTDDASLETIQLTCAEPNGWTANPRVVRDIALAHGLLHSPHITVADRAAYLRSLADRRTSKSVHRIHLNN